MTAFYFEAKGQKWMLSPLNIGEYKQFAKHVQLRKYNEFREMKLDTPEAKEVGKELLRECLSNPVDVFDKRFLDAAATIDGICSLTHLSLKPTYPRITIEEVSEMINATNAAEIMEQLAACMGWLDGEEKKTTPTIPADGTFQPSTDPSQSVTDSARP